MNFTSNADTRFIRDREPPPYSRIDPALVSHVADTAPYSGPIFSAATLADATFFLIGRRLRIRSLGQPRVSLPIPPRELEITITDSFGNLVYTSTRAKRCSGNAILSHAKQGDLISTSYPLGPRRGPVLMMIQPLDVSLDIIRIETRWTSRATAFTLPNGRSFEWFYAKSEESNGPTEERTNELVLREIHYESRKRRKITVSGSQAIAKLIRTAETRTAGTTRHTAGNGGEMVFDVDATQYLDESIIVATCLMMLKREIDRRIASQFALVAAMIG